MLQYGKIVTKLGYDARFQDFKVQNIVGSTDVKFPIRLEGLAYSHAVFASVRAPSPSPDSLEPPHRLRVHAFFYMPILLKNGKCLIFFRTPRPGPFQLRLHRCRHMLSLYVNCSMSQSCSQDSSTA